jgi:hypothetical protein
MKKSMIVLAVAMLLGLGVMFAHPPAQQESKTSQQHKPRIDKKEQSRRIYKGLGNQYDTKIPEAAAKAKGDIKTEIEIGLPTLDPFATPSTVHDLLKRRGCDADAIVIATVKSEASFLTEDESFLYTNHQLTVEDVLKDNPDSPLRADDTITTTRTGGIITLNGKRVFAVNKSALPLQLNKRYLLFLTYLPERAAYVADNLSYQLTNGKIIKATAGQGYPEEESGKDSATLIETVRDATARPCPNTQRGAQ